MKLLLAGESYSPKQHEQVIFLAGPTTRKAEPTNELTTWRQLALKILEVIGFDGVVCIPEPYTGATDQQISWEQEWLGKATTIVFWIPRNYQTGAYATVTNLEFGQWISAGQPKVMYGRPVEAQSVGSNDWHAKNNNVEIYTDLKLLLTDVSNLNSP